jgi:hypothetical protein
VKQKVNDLLMSNWSGGIAIRERLPEASEEELESPRPRFGQFWCSEICGSIMSSYQRLLI